MSRSRVALVGALAAATAAACSAPPSLGGDSVDPSSKLAGLRLAAERPVGERAPEPSDLAFDPTTGTFWTVSDQDGSVHRIAPDGAVAGAPIQTKGRDLEGVALDSSTGHLFVADEATSTLIELTRDGDVVGTVAIALPSKNAGLEGIALDPKTGGFVLAHERNPAELLFVDRAGAIASRIRLQTEDVSAVAVSPDGSRLYVVARFEEAVLELDRSGRRLGRFPLNEPGIEGIAFDDRGRLFAVADLGAASRGMLYMYAREGGQ